MASTALLASCTAPFDAEPLDPEPAEPVPPEPSQEEGPFEGGTLRVGLSIDPVTIDPRFLVDDEGERVVDALFDPLVRADDVGQLQPAAAQRWEIDDGGTRFTFHLRDAAFHDGTPVTADDFVRTFQRIADGTAEPRSYLSYLLADVVGAEEAQRAGEPLDGVDALDDRTLEVRLQQPQPGFLLTLADPSLVPTPPMADEDLDAYAREPVGNGPFAMAGPREPGSFIRLTAVEDHHDPAWLDEVLFTVYPDDDAGEEQWRDLLDGQLHVGRVPVERREQVIERFGRSPDGARGPGLVDGITSTTYLYGFDVTQSPFDDPRLRRALSMAIDRERLAEETLDGTRAPATAIVPPPIPGAQRGWCDHCQHDPEGAADLLDEVVADLLAAEAEDATDDRLDPDSTEGEGPGDDGDDGDDAPAGEGRDEGDDAAAGDGPNDGDADAERAGPQDDGVEGGGSGDDEVEAEDPDDDGPAGEDGDDETRDPVPPTDRRGDGLVPGDPRTGPGAPEVDAPAEVIGPVTLTFNRGTTHSLIAEQIAADIEDALDLEVDFQAMNLQPFVRGIREGEIPVFRLGWDVTTPDPGAYLHPLFHSSQVGVDNLSGFEDDEVDAFLEEARAAEDDRDRRLALRSAERRVLEQAPVMPVLWTRHRLAIAPMAQEVVVDPFGRLNLTEVWLDPDAE